LAGRIHGQQTQVRPFTAKLDVDATVELIAGFREQECALVEQLLDLRLINTWSIDEEPFDDMERRIDNVSYLFCVSNRRKTNRNCAGHRSFRDKTILTVQRKPQVHYPANA